ncbi:MAG: hypothetical protein IJK75_08350 [Bacteroidales bacterium]|nr:hypothetical protein [Bacteroidales bacterium]
MKRKLHYETPAIRREVTLQMRGELLNGAGSIVDNADVRTMGQEVQDLDFSGAGFNYSWGRESDE